MTLVAEHGVEKVRGGTFCTPELDESEAKLLAKMADSSRGTCYYCHELGHCTNECPITLSMAAKRGGDWECPDCGNVVFASKDECRCGKWKPKEYKKALVEPGRKPGDWNCARCGDHQFAKNKVCRKCGAEKPELKRALEEKEEETDEPAPKKARTEPDLKSGDWLCGSCKTHNYASRKVCFKCNKAKPHDDAEPIGTCVICLDKAVRVVALPCGHLCYCNECADVASDKCPMCQLPVTSKKTIYQ